LGWLEYLNDASVQALLMRHLHQLVGRSSDPEFIRALLFASSRSAKMFLDNPSFLATFLDCINGCIISGEPLITHAASHALEYVIGARRDIFAREIKRCFSSNCVTDFERESMIRVLQSCCRLLGLHLAESTAQATAELLSEPIAGTLHTWRDAGRHPPGLEVISETVIMGGDSTILCKQFLSILLPMTDEFMPNLVFGNESLAPAALKQQSVHDLYERRGHAPVRGL
jgi:hypothetical protein